MANMFEFHLRGKRGGGPDGPVWHGARDIVFFGFVFADPSIRLVMGALGFFLVFLDSEWFRVKRNR